MTHIPGRTLPSKKRPFRVTLLTWMVLIMTALSWLRFAEVLRRWRFLQSLNPTPPVLYLGITGLIGGLLGTSLVWGLFLGYSWAPGLMRIAVIGNAIYYWLDRLWIAHPFAIHSRWPFALGLTIALLIFVFGTLASPKTQLFFTQDQI